MIDSTLEWPIAPPGGWGAQKPPPGVPIDWSHPLTKGLVAFWPLNEGTGSRPVALTPGGPIAGTFLAQPTWKCSIAGQVLDFNGDCCLHTNVFAKLGGVESPDFSFFAKFYPRDLSTFYGLMGNSLSLSGLDSTCNIWFSGNAAAGTFVVNLTSEAGEVRLYSNRSLSCNQWWSIGFARRGAVWATYVNGEKTNSGICTFLARQATYCWTLGAPDYAGWYGNLQLAAAAIWHVGLSDDQIRQLHASPYCMFASGQSAAFDSDDVFRIHNPGRNGSRGVFVPC